MTDVPPEIRFSSPDEEPQPESPPIKEPGRSIKLESGGEGTSWVLESPLTSGQNYINMACHRCKRRFFIISGAKGERVRLQIMHDLFALVAVCRHCGAAANIVAAIRESDFQTGTTKGPDIFDGS